MPPRFCTYTIHFVLGIFVSQIYHGDTVLQKNKSYGLSGSTLGTESTLFEDVGCDTFSRENNTESTKMSELFVECTIDMDVMQELIGLILAARDIIRGPDSLSKTSRMSTQDECDLNFNYEFSRRFGRSSRKISEECQALVDNMREQLKYITEQIQLLIDAIIENGGGEYNDLVGQFLERIMILQKLICDLKTEHNQELEALKQELLNQQQCFIMQLNEKSEKIKKLEMTLHSERVRAMVSKLQAGLVGQVYVDFLQRNNDSVLEPLISEAYGPEYLEYISSFAKMLPHAYQRMIVYKAAFLTMGNNGHFATANVLLLLKILKDEPARNMDDLGALLSNCTTFANAVITIWGANIRSSNPKLTKAIVEFGSSPKLTFAGYVFTEMLPQILRVAYSNNPNNTDALISFTGQLRWNVHKYTAVTNLTEAFTNPENKLKLAFKVKDILTSLDGPDGDAEEWRRQYETYKASLNSNVRDVVWHTKCNLIVNNVYLGSGYRERDFVNRIVTTSRTPQVNSWWIIENFLEGNTRYFRIKNEFVGEYLGAHLSYAESGSNGKVVTAKSYGIDKRFNVWAIKYGEGYPHEILLRHQGRPGNLDGTLINLSGSSDQRSMYVTLECE